jgi:hypothetical protein
VSATDEIRTLLQRYSRAADRRDVAMLASLFHPEAEIVGARGAQSLDEWLETMRAPRVFASSMHLLGDPLIVMDGDDRARVDTYAVVFQLSDPASGSADLTLGINYRDDAVRWDGGWVIHRRESVTLWMR